MRRRFLCVALAVALWGMLPAGVDAARVYVCEQSDGSITITSFAINDPAVQAAQAARLGLGPPGACWFQDAGALPSKWRADPRDPAQRLSQRHRFRRVGQAVVVNPTVMRPQETAIRREVGRLLPPGRMAVVVGTSLGDNLMRAVRTGDWPLAKALLAQIAALVGQLNEVLTTDEVAALRVIGREYEADFEP